MNSPDHFPVAPRDPTPAATPAPAPVSGDVRRAPLALVVIAVIGAALSFNAVRVMATLHLGPLGGVATAVLFDAAMWLSARWYIDTVRAGQPLRPALWLSAALIGATLWVNIAPALAGNHPSPTQAVLHGIGPAMFAAFTWIEAAIQLRAYRRRTGQRERIPAGEKLVHPVRALRVWLMMTATGTLSYTGARAMCQNREARRRTWQAQHRPAWRAWLLRHLRPGWRAKVASTDPVAYVAYRWGAFTADAHTLTAPIARAELPEGRAEENARGSVPGNSRAPVPENTGTSVPGNASVLQTPGVVGALSGPGDRRALRGTTTPMGGERPPRSAARTLEPRTPAQGGQRTARGTALPEGVTSGRDLDAAVVAALIQDKQTGEGLPSVRQVMRAYAVSYDKATKALTLVKNTDPADVPEAPLFPAAFRTGESAEPAPGDNDTSNSAPLNGAAVSGG